MAALVSTPAVAYATTTHWIAAPAAAEGDLAWLEVERGDGSVRTTAAFRGDRLLIKVGGKALPIVDEPCDARPCDVVRAPAGGAGGSFAYSVALPDAAAFAASVTSTGASTVLAETTDPAAIAAPWPVATTAGGVIWVQDGAIRLAGSTGGVVVELVPAASTGGTVTALSASAFGIAWAVTGADGVASVIVRTAAGAVAVRAQGARGTSYGAPALLDDGAVVALRRTGRRADLVAIAPDGKAGVLRRAAAGAVEPTRPTVAGTLVAARLHDDGGHDAIWVFDLARKRSQRVSSAPRSTTRLSDPSLGGGRLVWASTEIRGSRLVRARILSAAVRVR